MSELTPALSEVVEFMQLNGRTRTVLVAGALEISVNAAYKRLRRLRELGVVQSWLDWVRLPGSGFHAPRIVGGERQLMSWLNYSLKPEEEWGSGLLRGEIQSMFDPRRAHAKQGGGNGGPETP